MEMKKKWLTISEQAGVTVLDLKGMEIWDGADMALLREALTELVEEVGVRSIGINMQYVKYIPSGYFGMLYDLHEKRGVTVYLYTPQPNVEQMLWFQQFLLPTEEGTYLLHSEPAHQLLEEDASTWKEESPQWKTAEESLLSQ
ncbi:hypothetical protein MNBD_PLANCTO02-115 [hydrothermal vent metagenome]|uniref:STAS domain-containing protein n=1 Tax=hydrothermal vent metagenome TaxID=652676 RepID=A0A3B1D7K1_9ZZZZ